MQMSDDISNKTLAILVGVAIVISVFGLFISLSDSNITGMHVINISSGTGTASFSVRGNLVLTITDAAINLGTLEIDETKTSEGVSDWFNIQNDGSVNFNVYTYGASVTDSPFTSTTNGANNLPNNYYFVHAYSSESGTINGSTYAPVPNGIGNKRLLISSLNNEGSSDAAKIGINVTVPHDEDA